MKKLHGINRCIVSMLAVIAACETATTSMHTTGRVSINYDGMTVSVGRDNCTPGNPCFAQV
jgi:hypothetical protein